MISNFYSNARSPNVVGLPVTECASALLEHGVIEGRKTGAQWSTS
jgi:hypothetical protein